MSSLSILSGIKVLELAEGVPGGVGGRALADLGADVIKVEGPDGDWLELLNSPGTKPGAMYRQLNAGKQIHRLDLREPGGQTQMRELVLDADICLVGHRRSTLAKLGIDYDALRSLNQRLVYCHISGWGSGGPLDDRPATELSIQAAAGLTRFLGRPGQPPIRQGFDIVSVNAGLAAAQASLAALVWADTSGQGQQVEVSMLATAIALQQWDIAAESGPDAWEGIQLDADAWPPDHGYRCADSYCLIDLRSHEDAWPQLLREVGCVELADDPRFATKAALDLHEPELPALTAEALSRWSFEELERLVRDRYNGTIVPVLDLASALGHPQVRQLGMVSTDQPPLIRFPLEVVELK